MSSKGAARHDLLTKPLTGARWPDLERLFGKRGACGGCWCMYWRLTRKEYEQHKGQGNRQALKVLVETGPAPGVIVYRNGEPVGWCAVAPRERYSTLQRSRVLKRVDDQAVWSITCLFVAKNERRKGVSEALIAAAVEYACSQGARIVEGYPVDPKNPNMPDVFAFTGLVSAYQRAGFQEILRRSETRPIMRKSLV